MTVYLVCIFLIIASGKRSTILNVSFGSIIYYANFLSMLKNFKSIILSIFLISILGVSFNWAMNNGVFRRFEDTLAFDISDSRTTFIATSGRWQEIEGVVKHLNQNKYKWIFGSGFGDKYLFEDTIYGYLRTELKHYAHFSPAAYIFMYGVIFSSLLHFYLFSYFRMNFRNHHNNFFYISYCVLFFAGFFGATLFTSHMPWFFLGIISQYQSKKELLITRNQI